MSFHNTEVLSSLHTIYFRVYANSAARLGDGTLLSADIGKVALQSDNSQYYILQNNSPVTWAPITGNGAGSGGINYISPNNSDATDSVGDWVAYKDAAQATPVDGVGGSPTVTIVRSTVAPLRNLSSFLVTKDAANRQGEGVSVPFTIDSADKAKTISISLDYLAAGGFVAGSDSIDSDIEIYIYDITNGQLIQPTGYKLTTASGFNGSFNATFQSNSNSVSYRLILHIATTNAIAWTFQFDNIRVGPGSIVTGAPVQDWVTENILFTPSPGFGTVTLQSIQTRRVGDSLQVRGYWKNGTVAGLGSRLAFTKYLIDATKLTPTTTGVLRLGTWTRITTAGGSNPINSTNNEGALFYDGTTTRVAFAQVTGSDIFDTTNTNIMFSNGDGVSIEFSIPVQGWSSSVVMSNDTDTRVVAAKATSATTTIGISSTDIINGTIVYDTHGAYNSSTGVYTVPISGKYRISANAYRGTVAATSINQQVSFSVYQNNINKSLLDVFNYQVSGTGYSLDLSGSTELDCIAGDTIKVVGIRDANSGSAPLDGSSINNWITFERLSGASTIAATEQVNCKYTNTAGTSIGGGDTVVVFPTKIYDTHGAFSTGTGIFTAPIAGKYQFSALITINATTNSIVQSLELSFLVSSIPEGLSANTEFAERIFGNGGNNAYTALAVKTYNLNAGDTVALQADNSIVTTLSSQPGRNYLCVEKVG